MESSGFKCPVCGQWLGRAGPCPNRWCSRSDRWFSVVYPIGAHQGSLRRAVARYKYQRERFWAGVFAGALADFLSAHESWFEEFDFITGVPSYGGPGARRDWDPVGEVLAGLADRVGRAWTVVPTAVVKRTETPAMQGRTWNERQGLAAGPLRRSLSVPEPGVVRGARILVFDDVMTEGSTLREVARALSQAGAQEVAGVVIARPVWTPTGDWQATTTVQ